jgi:hypothetical protein
MTEYFNDADDGEILGVDDGVASCVAHPWAADPEELQVRCSPPHRFNELGPIHFTGSFTSGDEDVHEGILD